MRGTVVSIHISKGGVPKKPVDEILVTQNGLQGDIQKDKRYHGGPNRAVCLFSKQEIEHLQQQGHPIFPGSTGENICLDFPTYGQLKTGMILKIGQSLVIEITDFAPPCKTIRHSFLNEEFTLISDKRFPQRSRLYAKVLQEGVIKNQDPVECIE